MQKLEGSNPPQRNLRLDGLFASPFSGGSNSGLADAINEGVNAISRLKPQLANSSAFLGRNSALNINLTALREARIQPHGESLSEIIKQVVSTFEGLPNWGHPLNMSNICPQENIAAIISSMLTQVFSPNTLEAEYAWNTARAEIESSAMLAEMAGWNAQQAGGVYTYGGSGCWLYHLKYALSRVLPGSRNKGIRVDAKVLCSEQAHYAMLNSTDWSGLGMDNIIKVKSVPGSNQMDLKHLEEILQSCTTSNTPVVSVVCTMATTDACAFDPVKDVRALLDKYPNSPDYGKTFLYCDAVIGWSWLAFKSYNFDKNPLGFSESVLKSIQHNLHAANEIFYADAFGVDFHKNFASLTSSVFIYKDASEFEQLLGREQAAYLQERGDYNPHNYTLEVSRSASGSMAGWATLKYMGAEGIQAFLGRGLANKESLLGLLLDHKDIVCVNSADHGSVALLRIYPEGIDAAEQYDRELHDPNHKAELKKHNKLIEDISELLWNWFREGKQIAGEYTPYLSVTKGFRPAVYNHTQNDPDAVIFAIKVYSVNVFIDNSTIEQALSCILHARNEVLNNEKLFR